MNFYDFRKRKKSFNYYSKTSNVKFDENQSVIAGELDNLLHNEDVEYLCVTNTYLFMVSDSSVNYSNYKC